MKTQETPSPSMAHILANNPALVPADPQVRNRYLQLLVWEKADEKALRAIRPLYDTLTVVGGLLAIAEAQAQIGNTQSAARTTKEAKEQPIRFNDPGLQRDVVVWVVRSLVRQRNDQAALEMAQSLSRPSPQPPPRFQLGFDSTENLVMEVLRDTGRLDEAFQHALAIMPPETRFNALAGLTHAFAKAGKRSDAGRAAEATLSTAHMLPQLTRRSGTLNILFKALGAAGKIAEAQKLAAEVTYPSARVVTLGNLAEMHRSPSQSSKKAEYATEALRFTQSITDTETRNRTLQDLAITLATVGLPSEANKAIQALSPREIRAEALLELTRVYLRQETPALALEATYSIQRLLQENLTYKETGMQTEGLALNSQALAMLGRFPDAFALFRQLPWGPYSEATMDAFLKVLLKKKDPEQLKIVLVLAQQALHSPVKNSPTLPILWRVFVSMCHTLLGEEQQAVDVLAPISGSQTNLLVRGYNFLMEAHLRKTNPKVKAILDREIGSL